MTRSLIVCNCLIAVLLLMGCDSNEPIIDAPPPSVLPLAVGNQWVLEQTEARFSEGIGDTTFVTRLDTIRIERDTTIADERWFIIEGAPCFQGLYTQRTDGIWRKPLHDPDVEAFLRFKQPADIGDQYTTFTATGLPDDIRVTVRSKDAIRETEAGNIPSYHYERMIYAIAVRADEVVPIADSPLVLNAYLAPGIGFVEAEDTYLRYTGADLVPAGRDVHWKLVSYQLSE